ncbi:MAG: InlB B-repeat-containing protein [Clostridia bacterium]|nr:InlB B-repeat-containing protein [Clostridia bacterium]
MTKAIALVICAILLVSCIPLTAFAGSGNDGTVKISQDGGIFTVKFPAAKLNQMASKKAITKDDLLSMLPEGLYTAYTTGGIVDMLTCDAVQDVLSPMDLLHSLPEELVDEVVTVENLEAMISLDDLLLIAPVQTIINSLTADQLKAIIDLDNLTATQIDSLGVSAVISGLTSPELASVISLSSTLTADELANFNVAALAATFTPAEIESVFGASYSIGGKSSAQLIADADMTALISAITARAGLMTATDIIGVIKAIGVSKVLDVDALAEFIKRDLLNYTTASNLVAAVGFKSIIKAIGVSKLLTYVNATELKQVFKKVNKSGVKQVASSVLATMLAQPDIQLNGTSLFTANYDISINAIKNAVLQSLPNVQTFIDIADAPDNIFFSLILDVDMDDMAYTGDIELGVKLGVYGTPDEIAELALHAENLSQYVLAWETGYYDDVSGETVDLAAFLNIPEKVTAYVTKALTTNRISDRVKAALLKLINGTLQDAIDRLSAFTVEEIAAIIANYDTPITEKVVNVTLKHKEKAESFLNYAIAALNAIPEEYRQASVADFYFMYGMFFIAFTGNTTVDSIITRVTNAFASLAPAANIFDGSEEISSTCLAIVVFDDLYKVEFVTETGVIFTTFLPSGTDVSVVTKLIPELAAESWVDSHNQPATTTVAKDSKYYNFDVEYTVTFKDLGGVRYVNYYIDEFVEVPEITEKPGYDAEWYIEGTDTTIWDAFIRQGDYTVEAKYTPMTYYLVFTQADGSETVLSYTYGTNLLSGKVPQVKMRDGYLGVWSPYKLNVNQYEYIKARYIPISSVYAVIFELRPNETVTVYYEQGATSIVEPPVPEVFGYYGEWSAYQLNVTPTTIVTPIYSPRTFSVTFEQEDGTAKVVEYAFGAESINVPAVNEKAGYVGAWEDFELNTSAAITVKAVYTPKTYSVTFVQEDGTSKVVEYTFGAEKIDEPTVNEKVGYTGAWESYKLNDTQFVTVKAVYTPKTYTVTFCFEDGTTKDVQYAFGAKSITEPAIPAKEGYVGSWEAYELNKEPSIKVNVKYTVEAVTTEATTSDDSKGCNSTIGIGAAVVSVVALLGTCIAVSKKQKW